MPTGHPDGPLRWPRLLRWTDAEIRLASRDPTGWGAHAMDCPDGIELTPVGVPADVAEPDPATEPGDVDGGHPAESLLRVAARFS